MKNSFFSALCIAILLVIAAIAKWLYPTNLPFHLDRIAVCLEIVMSILILLFYRRSLAWAGLSTLFSLWLGYSMFWFIQNENCGCFGYALDISAGITTAINAIAIGLSFWNWGLIEKNVKKKILFVVIDGLVFVVGFLIAAWISWNYTELNPSNKEEGLARGLLERTGRLKLGAWGNGG